MSYGNMMLGRFTVRNGGNAVGICFWHFAVGQAAEINTLKPTYCSAYVKEAAPTTLPVKSAHARKREPGRGQPEGGPPPPTCLEFISRTFSGEFTRFGNLPGSHAPSDGIALLNALLNGHFPSRGMVIADRD